MFLFNDAVSTFYLRSYGKGPHREETCCHMGYSFQLAGGVLLYASHKQDNTYDSLCYTSCGALAGMRNSSMGLIRQPIAFTTDLHFAPK